MNPNSSGISILWNDEDLIIEPYNLNKKVYFCGKDLLLFKEDKSLVYQILSVDYEEVAFAKVFSDAEIQVVWNDKSCIPKKMKPGGQSSKRFSQNRDNEIVAWFKKINRFLMTVDGEFYIDISDVYYKRFFRYLHNYNKQKVRGQFNTGYAGVNGVYQSVSKLESSKTF